LTGVGNYSFQLIKALIGSYPELEYRGYARRGWFTFESTILEAIETKQFEDHDFARASLSRKLRARLYYYGAKSPAGRAIYRKMQTLGFTRSLGRQSLDLFHALNFVPPFDLNICTLPVVYDLSFVRFPEAHPKERVRWL